MKWAWADVDVGEEVVGSWNGSSCLNSIRADGKMVVADHRQLSTGLAAVLPSGLSWVGRRMRGRSVSWVPRVSGKCRIRMMPTL